MSPVQKYEAFVQVLTGEMTVAECADHWGVDRSTIMRARDVAKRGALGALASSRPGVRADGVDPELVIARDEAARLGDAQGDGCQGHLVGGKRALGVTAGVPPRVEAGTKAALLDLVDGAVEAGWTTARLARCSSSTAAGAAAGSTVERGPPRRQHCGRHRGACHHPRRAPGGRGAVRALGRHRRRLPQARPPRLLREPGLGVTSTLYRVLAGEGLRSARPPAARTGAGAAPGGLDRVEAPPDLDLRHHPLPPSRPRRLRHLGRRNPQMARHPRPPRRPPPKSRSSSATPSTPRGCGPPSRPAKPNGPATATTATKSHPVGVRQRPPDASRHHPGVPRHVLHRGPLRPARHPD